MKILVPYEVSTTGMKNPYLFLLLRELNKLKDVQKIQHGFGWLFEPGQWDVIHLHWPELLVKYQLPDMSRTDLLQGRHFQKVLSAIKEHKEKGAKVMLTIHNEKPHKDQSGIFDHFYREIYQISDGFIHLGKFSGKILRNEYDDETGGKPSFIIPHGDYSFFPNDMERAQCRKRLKIKEQEKLLLSFGAVRSKDELELGIDAFKQADVEKSIYLIAGSIPNPYRSEPEHYIVRKKLYTNMFNNRIRTDEKTVAFEEVQVYLKAADLVFVPRFNTLNSGNVALGFTFGKVVTGPGYGVIGETLNKTGNPVFDPVDLNSVSDAISAGFELAEAGHGIKNKEYANHHMQWGDIGVDTLKAYQKL
ncbi:hypothetical protein [Rhodohalobacter sulfatireducens]|uniref:Glycosyltransferase n=1 Tax=Rhodohalobacter sulfatireducens TaxID=2911366 RepID=A0ABS9KHW1_9BACT|nr:hypothetical protein [Rhodohalobacter sulfatireducens]MCG2590429.1 hypothetical protein [Rhodohalobacter sulfatireducens]